MMRTCVLSCAAVGLLGLAVGCTPGTPSPRSGSGKTATQAKDEAVAAMKARYDELDRKAEELRVKAEKAVGEDKVKLEAKWKETEGKRAAAKKQFDEFKDVAADKFDDASKAVGRAFDDLKRAVE